MTGSMVIEFEYEDEDISIRTIEKLATHWLNIKMKDQISLKHVEASAQPLKEAFGVGL